MYKKYLGCMKTKSLGLEENEDNILRKIAHYLFYAMGYPRFLLSTYERLGGLVDVFSTIMLHVSCTYYTHHQA